jgi:hypothetical protein
MEPYSTRFTQVDSVLSADGRRPERRAENSDVKTMGQASIFLAKNKSGREVHSRADSLLCYFLSSNQQANRDVTANPTKHY